MNIRQALSITLIVSIALSNQLFGIESSNNKQKPYILTDGLNTHLLPDQPTLKEYLKSSYHSDCLLDEVYILYKDRLGYRRWQPLKNIKEAENGSFNSHITDADHLRRKLISMEVWAQAAKNTQAIDSNQGIVCPQGPKIQTRWETIKQLLTGKEKRLPAIIVGTTDCSLCESINEWAQK
jgi:hypothetical protein